MTGATIAASPHASRFRTVMAVLVGLGVAALIVAGALAAGGRSSSPSASAAGWSPFSPSAGGVNGATEIASYVAPLYRISNTDQLSIVTVVNLETAAQQAAAAQNQASGATTSTPFSGLQIAVRPSATSSAYEVLPGNTIAYNLCGIGGHDCSIGVGTPSSARLLLLRREALELALYTFRYISGTQNVVALLPPGYATDQPTSLLSRTLPTSTANPVRTPLDVAVLFQRQELAPLLTTSSLRDVLPESAPPSVSDMPHAPEAGLVEQATGRGMFTQQIQQAQDGSNVIVLTPAPPT